MLVSKIMQVLSNLFGLNKKINASDVAIKKNNKGVTLDNYLNNLNEYSTDEQVIGKWIDGKTIYQKTFVKTISIGKNSFDVTNLSIDKYWLNSNSFLFTVDETSKPLNVFESSELYIRTEISKDPYDSTKKRIFCLTADGYNKYYVGTAYITINYTKTTD